MAVTTTPGRVPATPPPLAPKISRSRKPREKVLETQQALQTRTNASRVARIQTHRAIQDNIDVLTDSEEEEIGLEDIANLIKSLKETVANQNSAIEDLKTELKEIKTQNGVLQETVQDLQSQLQTIATPPQTTWA